MQTDYLRYFVSIVETGSIAKAARMHFMSTQGMSRNIKALEKEIGYPLFVRTTNSLELLPQGRALLPYAKDIVSLEDKARKEVLDSHFAFGPLEAGASLLAVYAFSGSFDSSFLDPIRTLESSLASRVSFVSCPTSKAALEEIHHLEALDRNNVAHLALVAFSSFDLEEKSEIFDLMQEYGYEYLPCIKSTDVMVVPESLPIAKKPSVSMEDVANVAKDLQLLLPSHRILDMLTEMCSTPRAGVVCSDRPFRLASLNAGRAMAMLPAFSADFDALEGVSVLPVSDSYAYEFGFIGKPEVFVENIAFNLIRHLVASLSSRKLLDGAEIIAPAAFLPA